MPIDNDTQRDDMEPNSPSFEAQIRLLSNRCRKANSRATVAILLSIILIVALILNEGVRNGQASIAVHEAVYADRYFLNSPDGKGFAGTWWSHADGSSSLSTTGICLDGDSPYFYFRSVSSGRGSWWQANISVLQADTPVMQVVNPSGAVIFQEPMYPVLRPPNE